MNDTLTIEQELAAERFTRQENRVIRDFGVGDTHGAQVIAQQNLTRLSEAFAAALAGDHHGNSHISRYLALYAQLGAELLALGTMSAVLTAIGRGEALAGTLIGIGVVFHNELWRAELTGADRKQAERMEAAVRRKHGSLKYRRTAIRAMAKRAGLPLSSRWPNDVLAQVGSWALGVLLTTLPDLFEMVGREDGALQVTVTEGALLIAEAAHQDAIRRFPVLLPSSAPPRPWVAYDDGGHVDASVVGKLLRTRRSATARRVTAAIKDGTMQPALDALNAIQSVAWKLNTQVLDVMRECHARGSEVPGLPNVKDYPSPPKPRPWEDMTDLERAQWKIAASKVAQANRALVGERVGFAADMETAESCAEQDRFYTACNLDWRGRVYALPSFNFQRDDRVRALFLFADGEPIGEEGLWWLKVHVANCGDFDKISKQPFEERVKWTDDNAAVIQAIAQNPLAERLWLKADKPFLFLAACVELASALKEGSGFCTHLPVSWDGSCSGLQHLSAMTRAPEGAYVNLTPGEAPRDVYQTVADSVAARVFADHSEGNSLATLCHDYGITRKVVKRNVMTYPYSSKKFGMAAQQREDLMKPLALDVVAGKLDEHPFGVDEGYTASVYLAERVYQSIEEIVNLPAQAMRYLQRLAKTCAEAGKFLQWTTPAGLPWENRYHEPNVRRVQLWLHDRSVKVMVTVGEERAINRTRVVNGVAPNFVHACDAAHLMLTINAARQQGIANFALVHDSFGCLASQSGTMHRVIRETMVNMYEEHDVLREVRDAAQALLPDAELPEPPAYGNLNLKDLLNARYAFA